MIGVNYASILTLAFVLVTQGQDLVSVTRTYPLETITWHLATEYITAVISAHTQLASIEAVTFSETLAGTTATFVDERYTILRTVVPVTNVRVVPSYTLAASLKLTTISRTLFPSIYTGTDPFAITVDIETPGIPGYVYTITGPIDNGVAVGTVVEQLSARSVIKTIPGPTVTHQIGLGNEAVVTENGVATTQYERTSTYTESFSSTLVTRHIASSSLVHAVLITISGSRSPSPSPSGSVSGIESSRPPPPTVTFTQDITASTTIDTTAIQTSVILTTLGAPQFGGTDLQSNDIRHKYSPATRSNKCNTKPTKCPQSNAVGEGR
ncbi:hypothetical protein K7432_004856 [Basidiobolus ranarum]|uniref:Uncharacterized protein n=1 Tax=Basidiobolus ranarum TaxID=34480 RepID=A0ABR2W476_9FUNG